MKRFLSKLHNSRGEMLLEALVAIVIVVLCISMLSTAILTAGKVNKSANNSETVRVLSSDDSDSNTGDSGTNSGTTQGVVMKFTVPSNLVYDGQPHGSEVTRGILKVDGLEMSWTDNDVEYLTDSGKYESWATSKPTFTDAGNHKVQVRVKIGSEYFAGSYTVSIAKKAVTLTSQDITNTTSKCDSLTNGDASLTGLDGVFEAEKLDIAFTASLTSPGTCDNVFTVSSKTDSATGQPYYDLVNNYSIRKVYGKLTLKSDTTTLYLVGDADQSYTYNSQPQGIAPDIQGAENISIVYTYVDSQEKTHTLINEAPQFTDVVDSIRVYYTAQAKDENNKTITLTGNYSLSVKKCEIKIKANGNEMEYAGTECTPAINDNGEAFTVIDKPNGDTDIITCTVRGSQTGIGSTSSRIDKDSVTITKADGETDAIQNYDISYEDGTLKVTPIFITIGVDLPNKESFLLGSTDPTTSLTFTVNKNSASYSVDGLTIKNTTYGNIPCQITRTEKSDNTVDFRARLANGEICDTTDGDRVLYGVYSILFKATTIKYASAETIQKCISDAVEEYQEQLGKSYLDPGGWNSKPTCKYTIEGYSNLHYYEGSGLGAQERSLEKDSDNNWYYDKKGDRWYYDYSADKWLQQDNTTDDYWISDSAIAAKLGEIKITKYTGTVVDNNGDFNFLPYVEDAFSTMEANSNHELGTDYRKQYTITQIDGEKLAVPVIVTFTGTNDRGEKRLVATFSVEGYTDASSTVSYNIKRTSNGGTSTTVNLDDWYKGDYTNKSSGTKVTETLHYDKNTKSEYYLSEVKDSPPDEPPRW